MQLIFLRYHRQVLDFIEKFQARREFARTKVFHQCCDKFTFEKRNRSSRGQGLIGVSHKPPCFMYN